MKCLIIFLLCLFPCVYCVADEFVCQLFNKDSQTLEYYCDKFRGKLPENCSRDQDSVESTDVIHLKIGCNNFTVLDSLSLFPDLQTLDVSYSGYKTLDSLNFQYDQLKQINASHNELLGYPWRKYLNFLDRFPQLIELDLSHNKIGTILPFVTSSIISLKRFYLSHNGIKFIQSNAFENLIELEFLDLSNNKLNLITANLFSNLMNLKSLNLENNPIEYFTCGDLLKMTLKSVYMSWDHIEYIETDCEMSSTSWTNSSYNPLFMEYFIVLNTNKQGFFSNRENQFTIDCSDQSFKSITTFKAGRIKFVDILELMQCFGASLIELDVSGSPAERLTASTLERFINLKKLSLRETHLLSFDFQMLQYQRQLTSLDISYNNLSNIENIGFSHNFKHFNEFLAVGTKLNSELIQSLTPTIQYLDISDNHLGPLTIRPFRGLTNLEELRLKNTNLSISSIDPFEQLENLYLLDISYNDLGDIDFSTFATTLYRLREFRAVGCNIQNATDVIQYFGQNLWTLDLSGNYVGDVNDESLLMHLNLLNLYLENANISTFDCNTLRESSGLTKLKISNNQLQEIDLTPLSGSLLELNLEINELNEVKHLNPEHFPKLRSLMIAQNQLSCEYMTQLNHDWEERLGRFEPQDQKYGEDCIRNIENTTYSISNIVIKQIVIHN